MPGTHFSRKQKNRPHPFSGKLVKGDKLRSYIIGGFTLKKICLLILGCLFILALTACSSESQTTKTDESQHSKKEVNEEKEKTKVEISNETFAAWKSITGAVWVNYSAEIKNTGNVSARIDDIVVDFLDGDEKILQTAPMISPIPDIIPSNETAYITESITLETVKDPAELTNTHINIESSKTDDEPMMLETDNIELSKGKHSDIQMPYLVTGTVTNPHSEKADNILISAALYNDKDELLGVLKRTLDISLDPNGSEKFELNYPELPDEISGKVSKVKVKAYNSSY